MKRLSEADQNATDVSFWKPDLGEWKMAFRTALTRRSFAKRVDGRDMDSDGVQIGKTFWRSAELLSCRFGFRERLTAFEETKKETGGEKAAVILNYALHRRDEAKAKHADR